MIALRGLPVLLALALAAGPAAGAPRPSGEAGETSLARLQRSAVKLRASLSYEQDEYFEGSGVAFTFQDELYILTSDHVVLHDVRGMYTPQVRQQIIMPAYPRIAGMQTHAGSSFDGITLVGADWGYGLALLKMEGKWAAGSFPLRWEDGLMLKDRPAGDSSLQGRSWALGFPVNTAELLTEPEDEARGAVADEPAFPDFHPLARVRSVRAHTEFGMSGGPVFDAQGRLDGILSYMHHAPRNRAGALRTEAFAIGRASLLGWLKCLLERQYDDNVGALFETLSAQLDRTQAVKTEGLEFIPHCTGNGAGKECQIEVRAVDEGTNPDPGLLHTWPYRDSRGVVEGWRKRLGVADSWKRDARVAEGASLRVAGWQLAPGAPVAPLGSLGMLIHRLEAGQGWPVIEGDPAR